MAQIDVRDPVDRCRCPPCAVRKRHLRRPNRSDRRNSDYAVRRMRFGHDHLIVKRTSGHVLGWSNLMLAT